MSSGLQNGSADKRACHWWSECDCQNPCNKNRMWWFTAVIPTFLRWGENERQGSRPVVRGPARLQWEGKDINPASVNLKRINVWKVVLWPPHTYCSKHTHESYRNRQRNISWALLPGYPCLLQWFHKSQKLKTATDTSMDEWLDAFI